MFEPGLLDEEIQRRAKAAGVYEFDSIYSESEYAALLGQEALLRWFEQNVIEWDCCQLRLRPNAELDYKLMRAELLP